MVHVFLLQSACLNNPCKNNGTCQTGFTDRGYRCVCTAGFEGHNCQRGKLTRKQESRAVTCELQNYVFTWRVQVFKFSGYFVYDKTLNDDNDFSHKTINK